MAEIKFASKEHENFSLSMLERCGNYDTFYEAIRQRYPEYCGDLPESRAKNIKAEREGGR